MKPDLAVIGTGVVGQGVLKAWHEWGYKIIGYDVNPDTVSQVRASGHVCLPMDQFIDSSADIIFICISTPQSELDGSISLTHMAAGLKSIGPWLHRRASEGHYPMVVMRSTMLPKLSRSEMIPQLEQHSGLKAGHDFGYAYMPEILRETNASQDEANIWQIVIGALDKRTGSTLAHLLGQVFGADQEKLIRMVSIETAEASKIIANTYNATIISYFNQMRLWLDSLEIDSQQAIDLAVLMGEGSLNPWYGTVSGFPYGGKCLPKDVAAVLTHAQQHGIRLPQLEATQHINEMMIGLAKNKQRPKPIQDGFRRMPAPLLQRQACAAYDLYQSLASQSRPQTAKPKPSRFDWSRGFVRHWSKALRYLLALLL